MPVREPSWWYGADAAALPARLLLPASRVYGWAAERRHRNALPYRSRLPVICVGNFTAGGTGKTPLALVIAEILVAADQFPVFLTRGYGGRIKGPQFLDYANAAPRDAGDEPLLLLRASPVMVAGDRRAGAIAIELATAVEQTVIVMDDGLQNPALAKDLTIALVDARRGVGNGRVIPAGPLRAPLEFQLGLVDAIVVNESPGGDGHGASLDRRTLETLRRGFPGPVLAARTMPAGDTDWLKDQPLVAFAGIANPQRFFSLLEQLGGRLAATKVYADHHDFSEADASRLIDLARLHAATLVTTEKDLVRINTNGSARTALKEQSRVLPIRLVLDAPDRARLGELVLTAALTGGYRRGVSARG